MTDTSTICAVITPPGKGAISIIRVSGKKAFEICDKILYFKKSGKQLKVLKANTIHFGLVKDKEKVIHSTLATITEKVKDDKLPFEHLIYVGDFLTNRYKSAGK